ncbi:MAG: hypothetical protein M3436_20955 [Pseudomonadota bacterium]|nr:hypothetical protein [Pseudomonadota bacterium]
MSAKVSGSGKVHTLWSDKGTWLLAAGIVGPEIDKVGRAVIISVLVWRRLRIRLSLIQRGCTRDVGGGRLGLIVPLEHAIGVFRARG